MYSNTKNWYPHIPNETQKIELNICLALRLSKSHLNVISSGIKAKTDDFSENFFENRIKKPKFSPVVKFDKDFVKYENTVVTNRFDIAQEKNAYRNNVFFVVGVFECEILHFSDVEIFIYYDKKMVYNHLLKKFSWF